jgi:hypothetical protein
MLWSLHASTARANQTSSRRLSHSISFKHSEESLRGKIVQGLPILFAPHEYQAANHFESLLVHKKIVRVGCLAFGMFAWLFATSPKKLMQL